MSGQEIIFEKREAIALIRFNRIARRNAWNTQLVRETMAAIRNANADDDVRVIVLTGEGSTYSAGSDFKAPPEPKDESGRSPNPSTLTMGQGEHNWLKLLIESKPVIAAINGPAIGLGATHILAADIRVAAASATFSFPFLRLGAMPECASTALLSRIVGHGRALDLCLRAREIDAQEAYRIGLVTEIFTDAEFQDQVLKLAQSIAAFPALQTKMSKALLWENAGEHDPDAIMRRESGAFVRMLKAVGQARPLDGARRNQS